MDVIENVQLVKTFHLYEKLKTCGTIAEHYIAKGGHIQDNVQKWGGSLEKLNLI